jgi:coproporphyrinogen III oxidase
MREEAVAYFRDLQDRICAGLERLDGTGRFREDTWQREGGGGGRSRVLTEGGLFEKAGVNFSEVFGQFPEEFARSMPGEGRDFTATGVSLVLHPRSPRVPTVHANYRFLTKGNASWFGGGADLTPYIPDAADAIHFHTVYRDVCRRHPGVADYRSLKADCDRYFHLPHRGEGRGVGGIFFDYVGAKGEVPAEAIFAFVRDAGDHFLESYVPVAERHRGEPFTEREKWFQLYRRGRYVEFNLVYDRGTIFGLKTGGRIESILMSLPAVVRWEYDWHPEPGTPEAELTGWLKQPRDWVEA